jgi:hypothetical protein
MHILHQIYFQVKQVSKHSKVLLLLSKDTSFKNPLLYYSHHKIPLFDSIPSNFTEVHILTSCTCKAKFNIILKSTLHIPWGFWNKMLYTSILVHSSKSFLWYNYPKNTIQRIWIGYEIFSAPCYFGSEYFYYIQLQEPHIAECGCDSQLHADIFLMLICWCVGILRTIKHWQINKVTVCLTKCIGWY